jgi:parallel beta-helix repeat protein
VHYEEYTPGVFTIILTSGTLLLSDNSTYIYGNTQSVNQGDTNPGGWEIEVYDGTKSYPVFTITSDFNILMYMSITSGTIGVDLSDDANWNTLNTNGIGVDGDAALKVPNGNGVQIRGSSDFNTLVGNVIAGNDGFGVAVSDSNNNDITRNYIGTNPGSVSTLGNGYEGVNIAGTSTGNIIGGGDSDRNVISCNGYNGVRINGASGNVVSYNHIGTNYAGTIDLGNMQSGVQVTGGAGNTVISHNLISGNSQDGVYITGTGTDSTSVTFNLIGSNLDVTASIPNDWHGIGVFDGPTLTSVSSNVIVGNGWSGLVFQNAINNTATGNYIGTDSTGTLSTLGNTYYGVHIIGDDNTVSGGIIAYNGSSTSSDGVRVDGSLYSSIHNRITEVSIFYNGGKGIENINGGNNNYTGPVLDPDLSCVHVSGTVPSSKAWIEIFTGPDDEGKEFEGSTVSDGMGIFSWNGSMRGYTISLTWSDPSGSTSEFTATNNYPSCNSLFLPLTIKQP